MTRTLVLDKRYKGVGRIKRATGTNDPVEFQRIAECFKTLEIIAGGVEVLKGVRDGKIHPRNVVSAFHGGTLNTLMQPERRVKLMDAVTEWAAHDFEGADKTRDDYVAFIERAVGDGDNTISDIPQLMRRHRRKLKARRKPTEFNRCKSALQSFLRDIYGRRHWIYQELRDVKGLKTTTRTKPNISVERAKEIREALGVNGNMWWSMCLSGMNPKEYFSDGWEVDVDRLRIHGQKRTQRERVVPLVGFAPVVPRLRREGFKTALQRAKLGVTPKNARDAYAQWMVLAGIPRPHREMLLGHGARDVQDVYEFSEMGTYLAEYGQRMKDVIYPPLKLANAETEVG